MKFTDKPAYTSNMGIMSRVQRAAEHGEGMNTVLKKDMEVSKVELNELWTFVQ